MRLYELTSTFREKTVGLETSEEYGYGSSLTFLVDVLKSVTKNM